MGLLNSLSIGYSGLSAAQVGISTTGNNISNAETEGYTRQRVVTASATPLSTAPGNVGNGVVIEDIKRIFDNFVFERYNKVSADKEFSDFNEQTLEELSTYFPDIDGVGIKSDLSEYYNMWQTFSDNPDNDAIKVALAKQTETLTNHINQTQEKVLFLQSQMNDQLSVNIKQVNELAEQLASLNTSIDTAEAGDSYSANDLRDKRNVIERTLSRLIGAEVSSGSITANIGIDSNANTKTGSYTVNVNGFNLVDGNSFHPIAISNKNNPSGFYEVFQESQDGTLIPMEQTIRTGKIGAIFALRGGAIDTTSGEPRDGVIQKVVSELNAFSKGLIETTNNLYAATSRKTMESNTLTANTNNSLLNSGLNIDIGSFDMVVYSVDGAEVARRSISIDYATSMSNGTNSIQAQIEKSVDDNNDSNANNNIDDFIQFDYESSASGELKLQLGVNPLAKSQGYLFAIEDNLKTKDFSSGTNFAGALGLGRYFDGDDALNIKLSTEFSNNPTLLSPGYSGTSGDNRVALNMIQQQFEKYEFKVGNQSFETTINGMYDITATYVGIATNAAITKNETVSTQFNATEIEYFSIAKVSIDEEMTNLIKYQTSYSAAAKLITTIDQMMQTLLGMKQ